MLCQANSPRVHIGASDSIVEKHLYLPNRGRAKRIVPPNRCSAVITGSIALVINAIEIVSRSASSSGIENQADISDCIAWIHGQVVKFTAAQW